MKRILVLLSALFVTASVVAQDYTTYYQSGSEPQTLIASGYLRMSRKEIILPTVDGYTPYKADLHIHSTYSDGVMNIKGRMEEAWCDGLDVIAMTDHLSIRPVADKEGEVTPESAKVKRGTKPAKAVESSIDVAKSYGLLVIPGVELTGDGETQGHYNALFINDIKSVYDYKDIQAVRNARQQGALIMHNHPGWRHKTMEMNDVEKAVYAENLIDGIELMNQGAFYPGVFEIAKKHNLFLASNTDIHTTTARVYHDNGFLRNMTLIFAKECTLESMREALESRRTLVYSYGTVAGEELLLKDFFAASVSTKQISEDAKKKSRRVKLTNNSSIPYTLRVRKGSPVMLRPMSSIIVTAPKNKPISCTVLNMLCGANQHPTVEIPVQE